MKLLVEWDDESLVLEPGKTYVLGRDSSSDIPIYSERISRSHLRFSFEKKNWVITDLGSSNGSYVGTKKFEVHQVINPVVIDLGGAGNFSLKVVPLEGSSTQIAKAKTIDRDATKLTKVVGSNYQKDSSELARVRLQQRIRIGRDSESEWHVDDLNVSRNHAEIVQNSSGNYEIVDLKSTNGTFLNGTRVKREVLKTGDIVSISGFARRFTLDGLQILEGIDGMSVSAREIHFNIGKKPLLQDVSFNLGPRTLTAIVGPSGGGK